MSMNINFGTFPTSGATKRKTRKKANKKRRAKTQRRRSRMM